MAKYEKEYTIHKTKYKSIESDIKDLFIDKEEKALAKDLVSKYLQDYTIETVSDKNTLGQLVYLEILHFRMQNILNAQNKPDEKGQKPNYVSEKLIDAFHKNLREIVGLKEKLGITRENKDEEAKDAYSYLETIKKKYQIWLKENQASRYLTCPHCSEAILLKIKTDAWEAQKHPWFRDRILSNTRIVELYARGTITKEDVAAIFEVSTDYADWLTQKWCRKGYLSADVLEKFKESNIKNDETTDLQSGTDSADNISV